MRPAVKQFNAATNPLHHQERTLGMPHQDTHQSPTNLQALKAIFGDLIPLHVDQLPRHGNATISPQSLIAVAIACWGWTTEGTPAIVSPPRSRLSDASFPSRKPSHGKA